MSEATTTPTKPPRMRKARFAVMIDPDWVERMRVAERPRRGAGDHLSPRCQGGHRGP